MSIKVVALLTGLLASYSAGLAAGEQDPVLEHARKLLSRTLLIGHNDVPWAIRNDPQAGGVVEKYDLTGAVPGQTDFRRVAQGHVGGKFWSITFRERRAGVSR